MNTTAKNGYPVDAKDIDVLAMDNFRNIIVRTVRELQEEV